MKVVAPNTGKSYYSKRRQRYDVECQPRELTFSCYRRYKFLGRDRTREWFCQALPKAASSHDVDLWAYVIMPEHVHLLVLPEDKSNEVSSFLRTLKEPVARKAIKHLRTTDSVWLDRIKVTEKQRVRHRFWQPGGGYDRNVTDVATLRSMIDYIHANPVRRGLVDRPEDWEWSSARWYAGFSSVKVEMAPGVLEELARE